MGIIKTLKGDDGRPYISLEDLIKEIEEFKNYRNDDYDIELEDNKNFVNIVLKTLKSMENEYYEKYLFKKPNDF